MGEINQSMEIKNQIFLMTNLQIEQVSEVYNCLYDLVNAIMDTKEAIADAYEHPLKFIASQAHEKIHSFTQLQPQEMEEAITGVASKALLNMQHIQSIVGHVINRFPSVDAFLRRRLSHLSDNFEKIQDFLQKAVKIVGIVSKVLPFIAAAFSIVKTILSKFI